MVLNQENYEKRYNSFVDRYEEKKAIYEELTATIVDKKTKSEIIGNIIKMLKKTDEMVETFDEGLWGGVDTQFLIRIKWFYL